MEIVILALIAGTGITFSLFKLFKALWVFRFEFLIDLTLTAILPWLFLGTFSGMALAVLTGITVSVELWIIRSAFVKYTGYEITSITQDLKEKVGFFRNRRSRRAAVS